MIVIVATNALHRQAKEEHAHIQTNAYLECRKNGLRR